MNRGSGGVGRAVSAYTPILLATLVVVFPLLWMLLTSIKPNPEIITQVPAFLPRRPTLEHYAEAAERVPFGRLFLNSTIVTVVGAALKVALAIATAYALVFVRFPGRNVVFALLLVTLMVPPQVAVLPNYLLVTGLGGADTYWGIILPGLGTARSCSASTSGRSPRASSRPRRWTGPGTGGGWSGSWCRSPRRPSPPSRS
ncbi:hypothetical protein GCM10023175_26300 [Pseudonocardia xishanensis]|uniref:Carbohydrate ABC transporter permease n=1 Tax=Pseudonocardia xishanensis TaxID=630995 RepID=A0ABP8RRZ5_9PSEU